MNFPPISPALIVLHTLSRKGYKPIRTSVITKPEQHPGCALQGADQNSIHPSNGRVSAEVWGTKERDRPQINIIKQNSITLLSVLCAP